MRPEKDKLGLMLDREHSKTQCLRIVNYIGDNQSRCDQLVKLFIEGPYRRTQRAAWPLSILAERSPLLIKKHIPQLINFLSTPGLHDAAKRNILRLLQEAEIPKRSYSKLIDYCFRVLTDNGEPVAVQVFAMTVLSRITHDYPELRRELYILLEDHLPYATAGYRSRALKVLKDVRSN